MRFTIFGFNQNKLVKFGLDVVDALLLRYFIDFKDSGSMVKEIIQGNIYYWLNYEGVMRELPILNYKKDSIYRRFKYMAQINILNHKTIKSKGIYSYYSIGSNYLKLISDCNSKASDLNPYPSGLKSDTLTDFNPEQKINILKDNSTKDNNIYALIVDYLNKKLDTNYKATTKKTKELIRLRIKEGFSKEDFYKVIDNKVSEWLNTDMQKYLRPETLFGSKFEGYLNEKSIGGIKNGCSKQNTSGEQSDEVGFSV